eukprot:406879_1
MKMQPSAPEMEDIASGGELEMQTLLTLPGTRCFTIVQGNRTSLGQGELNVCLMDDKTLLLYIPNVFHYAITKQFPSLKASQYSFVFPGHNHMCFGIVLSISVSGDDIEMFEGLLSEFSQYQIDEELQNEAQPSEATADKDTDEKSKDAKYAEKGKTVASYIKQGTALAAKGIQKTTSVASLGIRKSNEFIKKKIKTRKQVEVSDKTKGRIQKAKLVSKGAVKVTKSIAIGAKVLCSELAAAASDAASKTEMGQKFSNSDSGKIQAVKDVSKATIVGTLTIIEELHNAAVVLVAEIADSGADLAGYKYGDEVGGAAQDVATVVKDGSLVIKNVHELGWKQMAQTMTGQGAIDMMSTEEEKEKQRTER